MINVIGLGYIGLPTALMFATHGMKVVGTDYDTELISTLNHGHITFKEEGLDKLFNDAISAGIIFTAEYKTCGTYIIAVPTPYNKKSKKIDPSYVIVAIKRVLEVAPEEAMIIIESTVSPGTIDHYIRPVVVEHRKSIQLVHAPERIIPGNMVNELLLNNRTIGADNAKTGEEAKQLYSTFCQGKIAVTDIRTAEMTKVVENTYRDINIAFANELQKICRSDGMDVHEIIRIANMHPRVNILQPGPGVGGHCISVDPWFLVGDYPELARLIRNARETNDSMPEYVLNRAFTIMKENNIDSPTKVGIYGLTYKENVDDIRESPTLQMLESMKQHLCANTCKVYDPWIEDDIVPNQTHDFSSFLDGLEMIILMVGHSQILEEPRLLDKFVVLDTRNVLGCGSKIYKL